MIPIIIIVAIVIVIIVLMYSARSKYDTEVWAKYGLKPIESEDLDIMMADLNMHKDLYKGDITIQERIGLRMQMEELRSQVSDWYNATGKELGLDDEKSAAFAKDMVKKYSI
jgi:hypothetical protein